MRTRHSACLANRQKSGPPRQCVPVTSNNRTRAPQSLGGRQSGDAPTGPARIRPFVSAYRRRRVPDQLSISITRPLQTPAASNPPVPARWSFVTTATADKRKRTRRRTGQRLPPTTKRTRTRSPRINRRRRPAAAARSARSTKKPVKRPSWSTLIWAATRLSWAPRSAFRMATSISRPAPFVITHRDMPGRLK